MIVVGAPVIGAVSGGGSIYGWPLGLDGSNVAPADTPQSNAALLNDGYQRVAGAQAHTAQARPRGHGRHLGSLGVLSWVHVAPASWSLPSQDVSTNDVNPNHPGNGQSARLGIGPGGRTPIKLGPTFVYDGMGNPMGHTTGMTFGPGHSGGINAGQITRLALTPGGKPVPCVFAWKVHTDHGLSSGWVPLSAISPRGAVTGAQDTIATRIQRRLGRDGAHRAFYVVPKTASQAGVDGLYVFRHEHSPVENKAKYFFSNGGMSGVMLNLPRRGDNGRFGIAADILPKNAVFNVDRSVPAERVDLYRLGSGTPSGKAITFVYGYFVNDAGQKRHGWMNAALLSPSKAR